MMEVKVYHDENMEQWVVSVNGVRVKGFADNETMAPELANALGDNIRGAMASEVPIATTEEAYTPPRRTVGDLDVGGTGKEILPLAACLNRLKEATKTAQGLKIRAGFIADEMFGPEPEIPVDGDNDHLDPGSYVADFSRTLGTLEVSLQLLNQHVERMAIT